MKVLLVHNYYQQPGGEDTVFAAEGALLESRGHEVVRYTVHNDDLADRGRLRMAAETIWSARSYRRLRELIRRERPAVMHCHNTFPQVSPAAYYAARREGVAVVQTLHNYRVTCVNGLLYRDGAPCEKCVGAFGPLFGVVHACYRDSRLASGVVGLMIAAHRAAGTWARAVDRYIALTEFSRDVFVRAGLPAERIAVKPNFAPDSPASTKAREPFALYVGRLSEEKGIRVLLDAVPLLSAELRMVVVGDGPMREDLDAVAARHAQLCVLGRRDPATVRDLMERATCLMVPSVCYENFPAVVAEAYAAGLPVVASGHGAVGAVVGDGSTGLHFAPGNAAQLADVLRRVAEPPVRERLGRAARAIFESTYTPDANYRKLLAIYEDAVRSRVHPERSCSVPAPSRTAVGSRSMGASP